jgi:hypothetical protein
MDDGLSLTAAAADECRCRCNRREIEQLVVKTIVCVGATPLGAASIDVGLLHVSLSLRRRCFNQESCFVKKK